MRTMDFPPGQLLSDFRTKKKFIRKEKKQMDIVKLREEEKHKPKQAFFSVLSFCRWNVDNKHVYS